MRSVYAIYRKEMAHYFVSPVAYIVVTVFLVISGLLFNAYLAFVVRESFETMMQGARFGGPANFDAMGRLLQAFLGVLGSLLLFLTPMLSMGLFAEERKAGTMELLMTSPITATQIVLGKFLASLTLLVFMVLPTALYLIYLFFHSDPAPPWRLLAGGYLGVLLLGAALLAIGSFVSTLTQSQLIAAVLIFGTSLLLWLTDLLSQLFQNVFGDVARYVSVLQHYEDFSRGVIDTTGLIYYGSLIAFGIFLTIRSIDSMRWRRA